MSTAQIGDQVRVQYLQLPPDAGSDRRKKPKTLVFLVGSRDVFPTLSHGVVGMAPGERKQLSLPPVEAYGAVQSKLIVKIPRARFPQDLVLEVGKRLSAVQGLARRRRRVTVVEINSDSVIVDANHPLAGKFIELEVQLMAVNSSGNGKPRKKDRKVIGGES